MGAWEDFLLHGCCRQIEQRFGCGGTADQFNLLHGARRFVQRLSELGIAYRYDEFPDNHTSVDNRMVESLSVFRRGAVRLNRACDPRAKLICAE
jgi:hypothetical protein